MIIEIGVLMRVRPESELEIRVLMPAVESFHQDFPEAEFVLSEVAAAPSRWKPEFDAIRIEYRPWRATQSQYRYRGTPNEIDLGEIF